MKSSGRWFLLCAFCISLGACGESSSDPPDGGDGDIDVGDSAPSDGDSSAEPDSDTPDTDFPDACAVENGGCDPLRTCTSESGIAVCGPCPAGYQGDGAASCTDINECASPSSCLREAECTNTVGSYMCGPCPAPYIGDAKVLCTEPAPMVSVFEAAPSRSASHCLVLGRGVPYFFPGPSNQESGIEFTDAAVESSAVSLTVDVERDGDVALSAIVTDSEFGTCVPISQYADHIACTGQSFDVEQMLATLFINSTDTGTGTVRIRYCSPMIPACSELRVRVTVDDSDGGASEACDPPPSLIASSDDGVALDDRTSDFTPTFTVTSTPNTTLEWYRDSVLKGTAQVDAQGIATFTDEIVGDVPSPGLHGYSVRHAGTGAPSAARFIFLTTANPH